MCGRAGWYGAGRRQETCEDKFPAAAWTDVVKNMAMMSRVTFAESFSLSSPLPPTYLLSGTIL